MYKVVSFDVFDTAIVRIVSKPKEVFELVEKKIDFKYSIKSDFARKRIAAESKARGKNIFDEVNLDEIYRELYINGVDLCDIQGLEISCEVEVCRANPVILRYYRKLIDEGVQVVFISDMYLSSKVVERILCSCGYSSFYKVYTSSDARCTKKNGKLFRYVLQDLNIQPFKMRHIGDNFRSDYLCPKLKLIHSKQYRPIKYIYGNSISDYIVSRLAKYGSDSSLGYSRVGPFVLGFVDWIYRNTRNKEKIFFLSRDGYLLKEIFDYLFPNENTHYLRVSRKSLRNVSMFTDKSFEDFCKTIPPFKKYNGYMMLDILQISVDELKLLQPEYFNKLDNYVNWNDIPNCHLFKNLYLIAQEVHRDFFEEQHNNFKEYLSQNNFDGSIAIVDLSFKGTAFNLIKQFCENEKINVDMQGYVIGKSQQMEKRIGANARLIHGWIFEDEVNNPYAKTLIAAATLYERFFFDSCGTTLSYKRNTESGIIEAILAENNEKKNFDLIERIQNDIWRFIENVTPFYQLLDSSLDGFSSILPFIKYYLFPFEGNVNELGDMVEDNTVVRHIAKPDKLSKYLRHPNNLIHDLENSFWKQGYLIRLFHTKLIVRVYNYLYFRKKGIERKERKVFFKKLR